ncbi:MAG: prepilin-type N-terminal cleavage/methylation domain-containing protein [Planctomycetaceae bacterium]
MILNSLIKRSVLSRRSLPGNVRAHASVRRGVTMIELVMVVLVIGILTALAAPKISTSLDTRSVDAAASLLQAELKGAQQLALTRSSTVTVEFAQSTHAWQVSMLRDGQKEIVRSVTLSGAPWNCQLSSLLSGTNQDAVKTASLTANGAGVWNSTLRIGILAGRAESRVVVDGVSGVVSVEQVTR